MRILQVFDGYGLPGERTSVGQGSIPTVVYCLAKYARERGHDVTAIERDLGSLSAEEEIRYVRIRAKKLPKAPYEPKQSLGLIRDHIGLLTLRSLKELLRIHEYEVIKVRGSPATPPRNIKFRRALGTTNMLLFPFPSLSYKVTVVAGDEKRYYHYD